MVSGHETRVGFYTAHQGSSLLSGWIVGVCYGLTSHWVQAAEEDYRWMRKARYAYACEDTLLKSKPFSQKLCTNSELSIVEDVNHFMLQCPYNVRETGPVDP